MSTWRSRAGSPTSRSGTPGLDLREVEDVVDDRQQRVGRGPCGREVVALLLGELGVERQLGHPDHAVQRRADLVAHVGEELALRPARRLGAVARHGEVGVGLAQLLGARRDLGLEVGLVLAELRVAELDHRQHLVEAVDERPDLVVALLDGTHREVALLGDPARRAREGQHRVRDEALEARGQRERHERGQHQHREHEQLVAADARAHLLHVRADVEGPDALAVQGDGPRDGQAAAPASARW